jgi:polyphosphate kinase 2 (PPK2 family)
MGSKKIQNGRTGRGRGAKPLGNKPYEKALRLLHVELVKLQQWVVHKGLKVCIVFEGRDGAGKGAPSRRSPSGSAPGSSGRRAARPHGAGEEPALLPALHPPSAGGGEIVIFDRSWYNRAGVERVMGFCSEEASDKFLAGTPWWKRPWSTLASFAEVLAGGDPTRAGAAAAGSHRRWPQDLEALPMDIKSFDRWDDYTRARDAMFIATDTAWAPWFVAHSEDKKRVRLNIISHLLATSPTRRCRPSRSSCPSAR